MKERQFEQIFERCLQQVTRTGNTEGVLRRYPQHADDLRPLLEIALATSRAYADVPEPPARLAAGRKRLLETAAQLRERTQATSTSTTRKETKPKMKLIFATRLIGAVMAAVVGIATIGGGATLAASDSLPGDVLYPVKLAGEDLRLSMASAPESQVELALQFADERIAELEGLLEREMPVPEAAVVRMERNIVRAMNQAAWASQEEMPGLLQRIARRTQVQTQTLEQLQTRAQTQTQAQLENAQRVCQQAQEQAMAGLDDPQTFRLRYQHRNSMPEDVTPPEPPTREPQNGGEGGDPDPQGPAGPDEDDGDTPQGPDRDRQQDGDDEAQQDRDRDRDREDDPQQDRDRDREDEPDQDRDRDRDREDDPQQDQDRDRNQDPQDDPAQDRDRDRDRDQENAPQQDQEREQQQEQQQDEQNQGGSGDDDDPSDDPGPSPQGDQGEGKGND